MGVTEVVAAALTGGIAGPGARCAYLAAIAAAAAIRASRVFAAESAVDDAGAGADGFGAASKGIEAAKAGGFALVEGWYPLKPGIAEEAWSAFAEFVEGRTDGPGGMDPDAAYDAGADTGIAEVSAVMLGTFPAWAPIAARRA